MTHVLSGYAARAPGKAMLLGEYAVLDGAPALVTAVDRYAEARYGAGPGERLSPFIIEAAAAARRAAEGEGSATPEGHPIVDSRALQRRTAQCLCPPR